mmetsp:Transcript_14748/g.32039  ORF Transcript_14748/g.32039 Transcript_14748/m.32039 type:complete len:92 (-) Transcript_14748:57-332(-)
MSNIVMVNIRMLILGMRRRLPRYAANSVKETHIEHSQHACICRSLPDAPLAILLFEANVISSPYHSEPLNWTMRSVRQTPFRQPTNSNELA